MSNSELEVLLVEDNPGDARLIEEMLRDAETLLERVDIGSSTAGSLRIHSEQSLQAGISQLNRVDVDVVLLDLGLPDSTGMETLTSVIDVADRVPVIVLTDRQLEAIRTAFFSGYFDRPRKHTGTEIAEAMGISQPTFSHHLREAQRRLCASLFGDGAAGESEEDEE